MPYFQLQSYVVIPIRIQIRKESGMHRIFSFFREQKGQAITEFALILPFLLILVGGIVDFGLSLFVGQVIENAAREGARAGAVIPPEADGTFPAAENGASCQMGSDCTGNASVILAKASSVIPQVS